MSGVNVGFARGYTGKLQVFDVAVSHLIKLYMRQQYESFTRGGSRKVKFKKINLTKLYRNAGEFKSGTVMDEHMHFWCHPRIMCSHGSHQLFLKCAKRSEVISLPASSVPWSFAMKIRL